MHASCDNNTSYLYYLTLLLYYLLVASRLILLFTSLFTNEHLKLISISKCRVYDVNYYHFIITYYFLFTKSIIISYDVIRLIHKHITVLHNTIIKKNTIEISRNT